MGRALDFGAWLAATRQRARLVDPPDPADPRSMPKMRTVKLDQKQLAEISGISNSYISKLERGREVPTDATVEALAAALGADPDEAFLTLGRLRPELVGWITLGGIDRIRRVRLLLAADDGAPVGHPDHEAGPGGGAPGAEG